VRHYSPQFLDQSKLLGPVTELNRAAAGIRDIADLRHRDISSLHGQTQDLELNTLAHRRLRDGVGALLEELSDRRGVAWSQLAKVIGVSVPAVRKWRTGQSAPSPDNKMLLATLAAFFDLLDRGIISDPAGWVEAPINDTVLSGFDVYLTPNGPIALLEFANGRISADELLDRQVPGWRERHRRDPRFRIERASDGKAAIVYDPEGGTGPGR
jgi:DNA-binding transcriptional regulator YiaG